MSERFSEEEVVASVTRLTRRQLAVYVDSDFVRPERQAGGFVYRRVDIARLELLCDLSEDLDLDETGLAVVISLLDQLHAARQDLADMARAIDRLPGDLRQRLMTELKRP